MKVRGGEVKEKGMMIILKECRALEGDLLEMPKAKSLGNLNITNEQNQTGGGQRIILYLLSAHCF